MRIRDVRRALNVASAQTFNGDALLELIKQLISIDKHWVPKEPGHSLYVRPTLSAYYYHCFSLHPRPDQSFG